MVTKWCSSPARLACAALMFSSSTTDRPRKPFMVDKERRVASLVGSTAPAKSDLIIDDNAVNRRVAQSLFRKLGWDVEMVASGEQALPHLVAHRYDLVLLDMSMPGMNGLEVCQHIRTDHRRMDLRGDRLYGPRASGGAAGVPRGRVRRCAAEADQHAGGAGAAHGSDALRAVTS
jgi:CheY-like chemotaxis protein